MDSNFNYGTCDGGVDAGNQCYVDADCTASTCGSRAAYSPYGAIGVRIAGAAVPALGPIVALGGLGGRLVLMGLRTLRRRED